jgi:voltage-gated potassium channel
MTLRRRLYLTLEPGEKGGVVERIFEIVLVLIITLNILAIILESIEEFDRLYGSHYRTFEIFSIVFFTLEYLARIYSIVENPLYAHPVKGRLAYAVTPLAIIDLLAFLPFYLTFIGYLRFLRIFRLMALFRMFKIARYLHALDLFKRVIKDRKEQLVLTFIFILFILIIISFVMFYAEHDEQPDIFSSIPATMWWGISTLTTVGYGDMVPVTTLGKILGGAFSITSVAILALPAGILSSGFFEMMHRNGKIKETKKCPHCGGELHDDDTI